MDATDIRICYLDQQDLEAAIEADHPCEDAGCDIAAAVRSGYVECAAHLLVGATECPNVEREMSRVDIYGERPKAENGQAQGTYMFPRGWNEWCEWHEENGRQCQECNGFTFADEHEPERCANCHAPYPKVEEDEE